MNARRRLLLAPRTLVLAAVVALLAASVSPAVEPGTVKPFNGKDLTGWILKGDPNRSQWTVGTAAMDPDNPRNLKVTPGGNELINAPGHGLDLYTEAKFGDAVIELEVMVPQGSNSGIYIMGEYEVQVLDSFGRENLGMGDMGAIYGAAVPLLNACKKPGEWQKYVIEYQAPRFDAEGKKTANARARKVTLNGQVIQDNVEIRGSGGGSVAGREAPTGPLMFQGNHGAVAYRNITIKPLAAQ